MQAILARCAIAVQERIRAALRETHEEADEELLTDEERYVQRLIDRARLLRAAADRKRLEWMRNLETATEFGPDFAFADYITIGAMFARHLDAYKAHGRGKGKQSKLESGVLWMQPRGLRFGNITVTNRDLQKIRKYRLTMLTLIYLLYPDIPPSELKERLKKYRAAAKTAANPTDTDLLCQSMQETDLERLIKVSQVFQFLDQEDRGYLTFDNFQALQRTDDDAFTVQLWHRYTSSQTADFASSYTTESVMDFEHFCHYFKR